MYTELDILRLRIAIDVLPSDSHWGWALACAGFPSKVLVHVRDLWCCSHQVRGLRVRAVFDAGPLKIVIL